MIWDRRRKLELVIGLPASWNIDFLFLGCKALQTCINSVVICTSFVAYTLYMKYHCERGGLYFPNNSPNYCMSFLLPYLHTYIFSTSFCIILFEAKLCWVLRFREVISSLRVYTYKLKLSSQSGLKLLAFNYDLYCFTIHTLFSFQLGRHIFAHIFITFTDIERSETPRLTRKVIRAHCS